MSSPNSNTVVILKKGRKERKPGNVVMVGMSQKYIGVLARAIGHHGVAQGTQPRTSIEYKRAVSAPDFNTRGVAAIALMRLAGAGDGTAHPPEPY